MKMVSLKQPCNQIQEISCVPNTPNTMVNCIGALVSRGDGDTSAIWMVDITTKKYTSVMIHVCHSRSLFLSCMYIHDKFMTESR